MRKGIAAQYLPLPAFGKRKFGFCKYSISVSQHRGIWPLISYNPAAGQAAAKKQMRGSGTLLEIRAPGRSHQNSYEQKTRGDHERGSPGYILAGYLVVGALLTLLASPHLAGVTTNDQQIK
jgi:hypothetical protein